MPLSPQGSKHRTIVHTEKHVPQMLLRTTQALPRSCPIAPGSLQHVQTPGMPWLPYLPVWPSTHLQHLPLLGVSTDPGRLLRKPTKW
ncbi:hypothetical protein MC885_013887 [Smutsia gigantea]|nr:hypothetical protein MC885_013887 [Smutsia gigantea]